MDRFLDKQVVITLKTGIGIKGIPTIWNNDEVVVSYQDSDNYTVIFNPSENIMMISVYEEDEDPVRYASDLIDTGEPPKYDCVDPPEPELDHFEPDPELRALKLADLHIKRSDAIKEQLNHHFKNQVARMPEGALYDTPNFQK